MAPGRTSNAIWPLRVMVLASVIGPAILFAYATWHQHGMIVRHSDERIERALDVLQEHALKAFQTIERTIAETNEVLRELSDEAIRESEPRLHARLERTAAELPHILSIWVFDRSGQPLVTSMLAPVPRSLDNSDRDYFRAQAEQDAGTFIGDLITARIGTRRFFVVSRRRPNETGAFDGVVAVAVLPDRFREFYARMSRGIADSLGILRADGAFLARHPSSPDGPGRLDPNSGFVQSVQTQPEAGRFTRVSQIDGIERIIGYRKVPGYPVYVQAGIETGAIWRDLGAVMLSHLVFGVPATLFLIALSVMALSRTKAFHAEVGRRELAEAALKQAQRLEALGQLTGGVAHDFNNLLMVVSGNAERLRRHPLDERQLRAVGAIESAAQRGATLTRQLLSFSRQQTIDPTVIDLAQRLPELQDVLRSSLRGDILVELDLAPDLWPIKVDPSEFELAILNIAVNARDAMPNGGRLTIAGRNVSSRESDLAGLAGDFVAVSLTDTGSGIPPKVAAHVFEPFFTTKDVGKGTGLGLSQVYGFARQSGGTATVASKPGQGATITLYLPRTLETARPEAHPERPAPARDGRGRILLVEDNAEVAEVAKANLEELGYHVTHASDAAAALAMIAADPKLDVVFSDIVMPGAMNGLDFARAVRERHPRLPVLLATGYSAVAQTAADEGFPILPKPYDTATLSETLRATIRAKRFRVVA